MRPSYRWLFGLLSHPTLAEIQSHRDRDGFARLAELGATLPGWSVDDQAPAFKHLTRILVHNGGTLADITVDDCREAFTAQIRAFISRRRQQRPSDEYRDVTDTEWDEFLDHFEHRKVELGTCGRAYATPCHHEHACIRCPLLRVDPRQRPRLEEIRVNLIGRLHEAHERGWAGEIDGLEISLAAATDKLARASNHHPVTVGPVAVATASQLPIPPDAGRGNHVG